MKKKILATALALALLALPALAQRDETVYAQLAPGGEVVRVDVGVRVQGEPGEYSESGAYTSVEALSGTVEYADETVRLTLGDEAAYFAGTMEGAQLPWAVSVSTGGVAIGDAGTAEIHISVSPNPACADPWFAQNLALQASLSVDLDTARILSCEGATQVVTGSSAALTWMALPGGLIDARVTLETDCLTLGEIQIAGVMMDVSSMMGDFDLAALTEGGEQLTGGVQAMADGLNSFEISAAQRMMLTALAGMESEDASIQLVQGLVNQLLPMLDSLDEMKAGVAALSDGLNQYVSGVNGAVQALAAEPESPRSFASGAQTDSVQFVLRIAAQAPESEPQPEAPPEEALGVWERILQLFGG